MTRIDLGDTIVDALTKLAEGNPGAVTVLAKLTRRDAFGFIQCCRLDDLGIYGPHIWMCYKDLCGEDIETLYSLLENEKLASAIAQKCISDEYFALGWADESH